jgi:hypothetical protein
MTVDIIAKTWFAKGVTLVTASCKYPEIIHPEVLTHRDFSRNSASMRAMPADFVLNMAQADPFVPKYWSKNQKGMQEGEAHREPAWCEMAWLAGLDAAIQTSRDLSRLGLHKSIVNRPLQPYLHKQTLITCRVERLGNFYAQRCHSDAEPHMREFAEEFRAAVDEAPALEEWWHLPFVTPEEKKWHEPVECAKVSATRSRRVSYCGLPSVVDGELVYPKEPPPWDVDLASAEQMISAEVPHWSPFEHQATYAPDFSIRSNLGDGIEQFRHFLSRKT